MQTEQILAKGRGRLPKAEAPVQAASTATKPQRTLSAAGRRAIAAAARKRWAAIKAGKAPSPFAKARRRSRY